MGMCIKYHRFVPVSFLFCAGAAQPEVLLHKAHRHRVLLLHKYSIPSGCFTNDFTGNLRQETG